MIIIITAIIFIKTNCDSRSFNYNYGNNKNSNNNINNGNNNKRNSALPSYNSIL